MSVFRTSAARPVIHEDEPAICFNCLSECDPKARKPICDECKREDEQMKADRWDHIIEREDRERIA